MNEFYSISKEAEESEHPCQLKNLGTKIASTTVDKNRSNSGFWGDHDGSIWGEVNNHNNLSETYVTPEHYDYQFANLLRRTKPIYDIELVINHHFENYLTKQGAGTERFLKHMRYVVLPILQKQKAPKVVIGLVTRWLFQQEKVPSPFPNPKLHNVAGIPINLNVPQTITFAEPSESLVFDLIRKDKRACCLKDLAEMRLNKQVPDEKFAKVYSIFLLLSDKRYISFNTFDTTITRKGWFYAQYLKKGIAFWSMIVAVIAVLSTAVLGIISLLK